MLFSVTARTLSLILLAGSLVFSQTERQLPFSHPLILQADRSIAERRASVASFPETTRVLVAMVDFLKDNNAGTTGAGKFDLGATTAIVDPPPHNRAYVLNHMQFLENYFRRVSGEKEIILATVLDSVYTVSHEMAYYSPPIAGVDNAGLGHLMEDAWKKVDSVSPGIPFENYQAFIILHAGVGHDVDLVSLYGYDPAPYDLPSLFMNLKSLQKMFGSSYRGVQVRDTSTFITTTIIMPETESRTLQSVTGNSLLPLGINGLLAASVGSYLGLPDLFNTKTGRSGIGRFGLMDGQSIFSWNGVFPPEPSAWERYFLGWVDPITITAADSQVVIPATSIDHAIDSVYKIPITSREYFLVENRNRDANRDSARVTLVYNGATRLRTWARDTVGLNAFFQDSLYGVLTDVDEFDRSLPSGIDPKSGKWLEGGLLIWHIDEEVIDASYSDDAVNADASHRGVSLMEADGSQDIGQSYAFLTAGSGSESGSPLDFWYAGNQSPLRLVPNGNQFTPTSHPASMSNYRANSHITIRDFSSSAPRMTARILVGDGRVAPLTGFPRITDAHFGKNSVSVLQSPSGNPTIFVATDSIGFNRLALPPNAPLDVPVSSKIFGWQSDGSPALPGGDPSGLLVQALPNGLSPGKFLGKVALVSTTPSVSLALGGLENSANTVHRWLLTDADHNQTIDPLYTLNVSRRITTSPVSSDSDIACGAAHGMVYIAARDGSGIDSVQIDPFDSSDVVSLTLLESPRSFIAVTAKGTVGITGLSCPQPFISTPVQLHLNAAFAVAGSISSHLEKSIVLLARDGTVALVQPCSYQPLPGFPLSIGGEVVSAPALADVDGDGQKDIVACSDNRIFAINARGSLLDNFPVSVPTSTPILASPIVADINGDGIPDIITVTQEGLVVAYDRTGTMVDGFPLQAGPNAGSTPAAFYMSDSIGLALASDDGIVYAWRTGMITNGLAAAQRQQWPQYLHDAQNTGLNESADTIKQKSTEFFPAARAYNWPNPVGREQGYKTHIRYYLHDNARVTITIFDLAGDLVARFNGPGTGGLDNEVEWDVSSIQSGVYFAHIDAQGSGGSGSSIIKIAVVK